MSAPRDALLDAVIAALEAEAVEPYMAKRLLILQKTRTTIEAWPSATA
jgi:hypothetical protein